MQLRSKITTGILAFAAIVAMACENEGGPDPSSGGYGGPGQPINTAGVAPTAVDPKAECKIPDVGNPAENGTVRTVVITAYIEPEFGPYTVSTIARDASTTEIVTDFNEPVADGPFTRILVYQSGQKVHLDVEVKPSRPGSVKGYLILKDGKANVKRAGCERGWKIHLQLDTAR